MRVQITSVETSRNCSNLPRLASVGTGCVSENWPRTRFLDGIFVLVTLLMHGFLVSSNISIIPCRDNLAGNGWLGLLNVGFSYSEKAGVNLKYGRLLPRADDSSWAVLASGFLQPASSDTHG